MKKNILYLLLLGILFSCAVKKPEQRSKVLKGFYTQYNTLFNAKDALNTEFTNRSTSFKDNFYAPYIPLLTYEDQPIGSELGQSSTFGMTDNQTPPMRTASGKRGNSDISVNSHDKGNDVKGASILEIAEAKALKAIDKYSVLRKGQEKNNKIFDAYIILAQSRIYKGKPLAALDALNQVFLKFKDDKRLPLAKIYQGQAYAAMKDHFKANEIFADLKKQKLTKEQSKLLSVYYSESLLDAGKKTEAIKELDNAFEVNGNRKLKSRIAFLRGQILSNQGQNEAARESFLAAYKYANNFEFEVKSQIEIAKTHNNKSDYEGAKKYLEGISKKGTYGSRKNEFYYALGLMANKAGKKQEAQDFFRKSLSEKVSDPQIRGLDYYEIGKGFFEKDEYIAAGAYYDSAIAVMTYAPTKELLVVQSEYIKNLAKNYYLVKKNDSILALAKMTPEQRNDYFSTYINKIKKKEESEERARQKEQNAKDFLNGDYDANSVFAKNTNTFQDFGGGNKGFYFANNNTVAKGNTDFKQIWGNRALSDNWRYSGKMASIGDNKNQALGLTSVADPRRYETSFYTEKIPTDQTMLQNLKKERDTAALGMGIMYDDYFSNVPLSTKTLYDLIDNKPEEKVMLQALYKIFSINYEKNPSAAERAKQILINDYPYTSYAEFARNPRNTSFIKSAPQVEQSYKTAYALYESERFDESKLLIEKTVQENPKDALVPKLVLLNAYNAGKTAGKEVMILQLEQIALNYDKTPEGEKAKQLLQWLKSDLDIHLTDEKGNTLNKNVPPPAQPHDAVFGQPSNADEQQRIMVEQRIREKEAEEAYKRGERKTDEKMEELPTKKK